MKAQLDTLLARLQTLIPFLKRYAAFIFVLTFLGIYVFQVNRIGQLIESEPPQSAVDAKLKPINQIKIDQNSIKEITALESQNVQVQTLFETARNNPFQDCATSSAAC